MLSGSEASKVARVIAPLLRCFAAAQHDISMRVFSGQAMQTPAMGFSV